MKGAHSCYECVLSVSVSVSVCVSVKRTFLLNMHLAAASSQLVKA
jgi:hypothetical protein